MSLSVKRLSQSLLVFEQTLLDSRGFTGLLDSPNKNVVGRQTIPVVHEEGENAGMLQHMALFKIGRVTVL